MIFGRERTLLARFESLTRVCGLGFVRVAEDALDRHVEGSSDLEGRFERVRVACCGSVVFDPRRHVILLLGGDKSGQWKAWYRTAIPVADDLYGNYLKELREEGRPAWPPKARSRNLNVLKMFGVDLATKRRLWTGVFDYDLSQFAPGGVNDPDVGFVAVEPTRAVHALAYGTGGVQRWRQTQ